MVSHTHRRAHTHTHTSLRPLSISNAFLFLILHTHTNIVPDAMCVYVGLLMYSTTQCAQIILANNFLFPVSDSATSYPLSHTNKYTQSSTYMVLTCTLMYNASIDTVVLCTFMPLLHLIEVCKKQTK